MSFTDELRSELAEKMPGAQHCRLAELAGMMSYAGTLEMSADGGFLLMECGEGQPPEISALFPCAQTEPDYLGTQRFVTVFRKD